MQRTLPTLSLSLPPLDSQDDTGDPILHEKFLTPDGPWTYYAIEGSDTEQGQRLFGYLFPVDDWCFVDLAELLAEPGMLGFQWVRDEAFDECRLSSVLGRSQRTTGRDYTRSVALRS